MANESLSLSELQKWYDAFNTVVEKYGGDGDLKTLTKPSNNPKAIPDHINKLYEQITNFTKDEYFKTEPNLYDTDYSIVKSGTEIVRSAVTPITNTVTGIAKIKCRNTIKNSSGTCEQGGQSNGYSRYACSNGTHGQERPCSQSSGQTCSQGYNGVTCTSGYYCTNTCASGSDSNGNNSKGSYIDILNSKT